MLKQALIELVDFNEIYGKGKGEAKADRQENPSAGGSKKESR